MPGWAAVCARVGVLCVRRSWASLTKGMMLCTQYREQMVNNNKHEDTLLRSRSRAHVALSLSLLPPVSMQSIISTRAASPKPRSLIQTFHLSSCHSLFEPVYLTFRIFCKIPHLLPLPISSNIPPCQSIPLSFPPFPFPPSISVHLFFFFFLSASNCCAEHPQSCGWNALKTAWTRTPSPEWRAARQRSHPEPDCTSSALWLTALLLFFFSSLQTNHMLRSAQTRLSFSLRCRCWQRIRTFLWLESLIL